MTTEVNNHQRVLLLALNSMGKHIYEGTVPALEKARKRRNNKIVRESRRKNRGK